MKLKLKMPQEPDHEHLAMLINYAVAAELRSTLNFAGVSESDVWPIVENAVSSIACVFDQGTFEVNGKIYRPRVAFVDQSGNFLPGAESYGHLHDYAAIREDELEPSDEFSISV